MTQTGFCKQVILQAFVKILQETLKTICKEVYVP